MTGTTLDPGSRPVIHATYELEHRTWLIRALLDDGREILAHTDRLTDIATTTRDQLVADAQLQPDSFDVTLTHRVRASIHPPAGNVQLTFTVAEVANLLHVDGASVYRWVKAGILIPVKNDGRHLSFGARAVRQLLAGEYRAS